ncbi:glycosyltransferase [Methylocaldum sp.]|uniref:glycosyltransferase family 2 protein n=1 Tax=Methylocaldum sp. TaxID=1969727 RepID=UPI00321F71BC
MHRPSASLPCNRPLFSAVLGSYNRGRLLRHAIESIRENSTFAKHEIIVIDGGSTDGSLEWLLEQKDVITIVQHNRGEFRGKPIERRSWGYFMNLGFKAAQGKYILMISDDCILLPDAIERGIVAFEEQVAKRKKVGGVAFYFRNWPGEREYYVQRTLGGKLMVNHGLFLREALEAVGWVDEENYLFYKADGDLCLRLWQAGYEIIDAPGAFVEHYFDADEAVRLQNSATLEQDRKTYAARWKCLALVNKTIGSMGKITSNFEDPEHTAERYFS